MCPGTPEEKADKLFQICVGPVIENEMLNSARYDEETRKKIVENQIMDGSNTRLQHAMRMFIYFSEIFPKKHRELFKGMYA